MAFSIHFTHCGKDACEGAITMSGHTETFLSIMGLYDCERYSRQWTEAIERTLVKRRTSALFQSVEINEEGYGLLWFFSMIPSENVVDVSVEADGVLFTHAFRPVCVDPGVFLKRIYIEDSGNDTSEEFSFLFLDKDHPARFFGYLDDRIVGISHWYVPNRDLNDFLGSDRGARAPRAVL